MSRIKPEQIWNEERLEWIRLTPAQRWARQAEMWAAYLALGGSLDPEPDPQSPFWSEEELREFAAKQFSPEMQAKWEDAQRKVIRGEEVDLDELLNR